MWNRFRLWGSRVFMRDADLVRTYNHKKLQLMLEKKLSYKIVEWIEEVHNERGDTGRTVRVSKLILLD